MLCPCGHALHILTKCIVLVDIYAKPKARFEFETLGDFLKVYVIDLIWGYAPLPINRGANLDKGSLIGIPLTMIQWLRRPRRHQIPS